MQREGLLDGDGHPQEGELLLQVVIAGTFCQQLVHLTGFLQSLLEPAGHPGERQLRCWG